MNKIVLLIGKKGSGKSFVGHLLEREFNIKFIRVEDWAKQVKRDRNYNDQSYLNEVFNVIENGIREVTKNHKVICFESLGLTNQFDRMIENLNKDYELVSIKLLCDNDKCLERVKSRDQSIHINISDENILKINEEVDKRNYKTNFEIDNNILEENELIERFKDLLN